METTPDLLNQIHALIDHNDIESAYELSLTEFERDPTGVNHTNEFLMACHKIGNAILNQTIEYHNNNLDLLNENFEFDKAYNSGKSIEPTNDEEVSVVEHFRHLNHQFSKALHIVQFNRAAVREFSQVFWKLRLRDLTLKATRMGLDPDKLLIDPWRINLVRRLKAFQSKAIPSDFSRSICKEDIGKNIFIACSPKSASTFLNNLLMKATGYSRYRFFNDGFHDEWNINIPMALDVISGGYSVQQHARATENNLQFLQAFDYKPIVLTRNIYDSILSMVDFLEQGVSTITFFDEHFEKLNRKTQIDAIIAKFGHWYVEFYASWFTACKNERINALWVTFEDVTLHTEDTLARICEFLAVDVRDVEISEIVDEISKDGNANRLNKGGSGQGYKELTSEQKNLLMSYTHFYPDVDFTPIGL